MKHIQNFIFLEMAILAIGALISNHNKIEVILGSVTPFFIYTTETSFYIKARISDPIKSTKVLIYGFIFKMAFFAPFLLAIIYFYAFKTSIFVFSFLCSIILFHVLEAMIISSIFNKEIKKHK